MLTESESLSLSIPMLSCTSERIYFFYLEYKLKALLVIDGSVVIGHPSADELRQDVNLQ